MSSVQMIKKIEIDGQKITIVEEWTDEGDTKITIYGAKNLPKETINKIIKGNN